ncbi:hypothetical protein CC2G_012713 [Coprinopsis cinerea AmutBmut pab1-1]|nr:hypothetical protein CC2G_012713 [Coprinopsis cinerea AmutBmut pab1-1]
MDRGRGGRGRGNAWRNNSRGYHNGQSNTRNSNPQRPHDDQHQGSGGRGRGRGRGGIGGGFSRGNFKTPMPSRMELMASVSRSSGLERDGDDLKNYNIQQEYREFIQGKLDGFSKRYPLEIRSADKQRIEAQENLLILFRKLREGVYASKRRDEFALEVYETSFYLSIIFNSAKQIAAVMNHLVPGTYESVTCPKPLCRPTIVLSLLYHLVASYPSQTTYHHHLRSISDELLPRRSNAHNWIRSLASALRTRNYSKFAQLYKKQSMSMIFEDTEKDTLGLDALSISQAQSSKQLAKIAILAVLDDLRSRARDTAWTVLRSAYREFSCDANSESTKTWLSRTLSLQPLLVTDDRTWTAEGWLEDRATHGHTRRKEGVEGRWIVCKVR